MLILGFLGSPRKNGKCAQLMQKTLDGAASRGAKTKSYNLIDCNIEFCRGCGSCYLNQPELPIGKCPLKDDMHSILEEYIRADGYVFASPVYDVFITALMKQFLERKIMLTYRDRDAYATIPCLKFKSHHATACLNKMCAVARRCGAGPRHPGKRIARFPGRRHNH